MNKNICDNICDNIHVHIRAKNVQKKIKQHIHISKLISGQEKY